MSAFRGYIWLCICILVAIGIWILNVTVLDNAYPQVLDAITNTFEHSIMDNTNTAVFFMKLIDYSPLLVLLFGIIGLIVESTVWGTWEET